MTRFGRNSLFEENKTCGFYSFRKLRVDYKTVEFLNAEVKTNLSDNMAEDQFFCMLVADA